MTAPPTGYYAQGDAEHAARQSQERSWQVEQAKQQAQWELAALQQQLDGQYQQAQMAYAQYESQARDALAAQQQESRMAEQRLSRPAVYGAAPPTPPGAYPQVPAFAQGGMVLPRYDMGGDVGGNSGGGGASRPGRFRAIASGTGYVIVDADTGRVVSVVYPDAGSAQAAADRLNLPGGNSSLNENSGSMGGPAIPAPQAPVAPAPAARPAAAAPAPPAAARPAAAPAPVQAAASAPQAAASAAPPMPPAAPPAPTTYVGEGVRRGAAPTDGSAAFLNPQTKQWQPYTPTPNPYQAGVDPDAPSDGGAYFFNPQTRQWQAYTPTMNSTPPATGGGEAASAAPPMPPGMTSTPAAPPQMDPAYLQAVKDREAQLAKDAKEQEMFDRQRDGRGERAGGNAWRGFAKGGKFQQSWNEDDLDRRTPWDGMSEAGVAAWQGNGSAGAGFLPYGVIPQYQKQYATGGEVEDEPMAGPPMPPGMEEPEPTAIAGEGTAPGISGFRAEILIKPQAITQGLVSFVDSPKGVDPEPGTIIIPMPSQKMEDLVKKNMPEEPGVPAFKSGGKWMAGGKPAGPPMPPTKKKVPAKGKK